MDDKKNMRVLIAVKKDILNKVIIENSTDLVSHSNCIILDIREYNPSCKKYSRKTRVIIHYDNKIGNKYVWQKCSSTIWRTIQDIY